jgi:hypothetical protein
MRRSYHATRPLRLDASRSGDERPIREDPGMRVVRSAPADEVTATFLRGDLESPRFRDRLLGLLRADGADPKRIARPDLGDPEANAYRRGLLGRQHEWLAGPHVFGDFPEVSTGRSRR